jgi:hypothetical protein
LEFKHNGVAPNSFSSKIKSTHLPINTKWGIWNLNILLSH